MKKYVLIFLSLLFSDHVISQIYYKEIVYVFDYTIEKENQPIESGIIYLGCLGKPWPLEEQRQAAIIWTTKEKDLDKKKWNTGIYEEKDRVWLHPPRHGVFTLLQYSPYPHIRFPVSENKEWKRDFIPGKNWVNEEFNIKKEDVLSFNYKNNGTANYRLKHKYENITCWKIDAESTNLKNPTSFSGLFNSEYGFVKMEFKNLDKSTIILELIQTRNWQYFQKGKFTGWSSSVNEIIY